MTLAPGCSWIANWHGPSGTGTGWPGRPGIWLLGAGVGAWAAIAAPLKAVAEMAAARMLMTFLRCKGCSSLVDGAGTVPALRRGNHERDPWSGTPWVQVRG